MPQFEEAKRSEVEVTDPTLTPAICEPPSDGFWPAECWSVFVTYTEIAEDNTELAQLNADIARDSDQAYDAILSAARKQQDISLIREEQLVLERKDHFMDNLWHRGLIVLGVLAAVL